MSAQIALEAVNVIKRFGSMTAVDEVSIRFTAGRLHTILGPNGAGKTTLFNLLTKDYKPDGGEIRLLGETVTTLKPHEIARRGVGRSYQITSVIRELSFFENVLLAAYRARRQGRFGVWREVRADPVSADEARRLLASLGLERFAERKAADVSYGDQRMLELAVTLATQPRVLLLDEPTAGLSQRESERVKDVVNSLKSRYTIVMIEHKMNVVMDISDDVTVMARGRVIASGSPSHIANDAAVKAAYFGL
ncbi:ABC transporter ATP-binding protein [Hydrogenophaga sp. YM1]|uniref:ABC transporter ATP-binding protein n=1 Tax=Hydrogenophaga sp. YM1 TaxID=2806262 RepID=UPI0019578D2F|nr:ABC transporter ATP-binding protein [Hydrogenophaga sp. YM1]QRR34326.1 ABC transporter ATP-binding protein [Hydrogenophaga sp. YM1]